MNCKDVGCPIWLTWLFAWTEWANTKPTSVTTTSLRTRDTNPEPAAYEREKLPFPMPSTYTVTERRVSPCHRRYSNTRHTAHARHDTTRHGTAWPLAGYSFGIFSFTSQLRVGTWLQRVAFCCFNVKQWQLFLIPSTQFWLLVKILLSTIHRDSL